MMTSYDRFVTKETTCDCGKGKFEFFTCQYDGWTFQKYPDDEWYEFHVVCENCAEKYKPLIKSKREVQGVLHYVIPIEEKETIPIL